MSGHDAIALIHRFLGSDPLGIYFTRTFRVFAVTASIPLMIGFIGAWADGLGFLLFILLGIPTAVCLLAVAGIRMWQGIGIAREGRNFGERFVAVTLSPGLLAIWLLGALPLVWTGNYLGDLSRLTVNENHYREIINLVRISRKAEGYAEYEGVTYSVDLGPPVRVAFNPEGFLDNWSAIVFDPSGDVLLARGFDSKTGKFYAPDRVTELFNGDLLECRRLWGDYYSCSFT